MMAAPGTKKTWRGRYRTAEGDWQWVESVNSNQLDDPDNPIVLSVMSRIAVTEMSVEEELRARKQIISRLADALPVGIFQIGSNLDISFTNDRLHDILGRPCDILPYLLLCGCRPRSCPARFGVASRSGRPACRRS